MRISSRMIVERNLRNLNDTRQRLDELQDQLVTGKRLRNLSDAPNDLPSAISLRSQLAQNTQLKRNIEDGLTRLNATDAALSSVTDVIQRAKELAVQGANATLSAAQRSSLATEVGELLDEAIAIGNSSIGGQFIFAGHQTLAPAFTPVGAPPTSVTYNGDAGVVERDIGGTRVQVNVAGDTAFASTFATLIDLRTSLAADNTTALQTTNLTSLDAALDDVLQVRGNLGSTANRLQLSLNRLDVRTAATVEQQSRIEDADFVETIVKQSAQQTVLEAALSTTARSFDTTLLNFLR